VQGVITGRIDRLAPPQQLTLKVASVIGRVFAFRTLSDIHPVEADRPKLADYLNTLEKLDITPLDAPEPDLTYIFKHIITREVAYNLMLFAQRRQLHRAVAEWYERSYAADLSPFYPLLAHHWSSAEEASKTLDYLEKAGEQALHNYANQEALHFFSDALKVSGDAGRVSRGDYPSSPATRHPSLVFRRARWERQLGESHFGLGNLVESREHFQRALALLGWPAPATRTRLIATLLTQTLRQIAQRVWPAVFVRRARDDRAQLLEAARAYERYGEIAYFANEKTTAVAAALRTLNLAERAGLSPELARAYANLCVTAGLVRMRRLAKAYGDLARETAQSVNHLHTLARVLSRTSVYSLGVGQWAEVEDRVGRAVEIFDRLGDQRQEAEGLGLLAAAAFFQGNFARGAELRADLYAEARHSGNVQHQAWGLRGQAENILRLGQTDEAIGLLETVVGWLAGSRDRHGQIQANGLLAVACLRSGDLRRALQAANTAAALIAQSSPTVYSALEGYAGVAEVYLALWEDVSSPSAISRQLPVTSYQLSVIRDSALQACAALSRFARVFPIGRPRAWLWQGLSDWLAGRPTQAHTAWRKSLAAAERLGMLYEQGLTHYEIGRHLDARDPARSQHLNRAVEIFNRLGAAVDAERARVASGAV